MYMQKIMDIIMIVLIIYFIIGSVMCIKTMSSIFNGFEEYKIRSAYKQIFYILLLIILWPITVYKVIIKIKDEDDIY